MFKSPFIILAAVGVVTLGGYFMFQNALSQAAKEATLKCELSHKNQAIEAAKEAAKDKEDIENEVRKINDIDAYGLSLGILRPDSDR